MISQVAPKESTKVPNPGSLRFQAALACITGAAVGAVAVPAVAALASGSTTQVGDAFSHITRSSAFVAYILLWFSMMAGLSITSKSARKWSGMPWSFGLHRYTTLLGLGFAAIHALSLLGDPYMGYTLGGLIVPFMASSFKPHWIGLGQIALYSLTLVAFSFYVRNRLGVSAWRLVHSLSFSLFLMALVHGLQSGSDSTTWWAPVLYWTSALSVAGGTLYRVMASRAGQLRERAAATGLVVVGGRAQVRPAYATVNTVNEGQARVLVARDHAAQG